MPDNLTSFFDSLREAANQRPSAPAARIHSIGMQRRAVRRNLLAAACATVVVAAVGTVAVFGGGAMPPAPSDSGTPTPSAQAQPSSSAPVPIGSSQPTRSATAIEEYCTPEDFEARPWYAAEGAMGTRAHIVILRVRPDGRTCVLGAMPVLEGRPQSGGAIATLPLRYFPYPGDPASLRVSPGDYVGLALGELNHPECRLRIFTEVSIVLAGDKRFPLHAFVTAFGDEDPAGCVWVPSVNSWHLREEPDPTKDSNLTRPPR